VPRTGGAREQGSPSLVPFVGLTGGLGAGKSTALEALASLGAATLSTDAVVHELYGSDSVRDQVAERFPDAIRDGVVDRGRLASQVFGAEGGSEWLEGLLWPLVGERVAEFRAAVGDVPAAVVEVPLLFESGMEQVFDHTIAVVAEESTRAERAGARGHEAVEERAGRQLTQDEKSQRADFTVRNDGTVEELKAELAEVLESIRSE
jgi:dephospho-CoA kinase